MTEVKGELKPGESRVDVRVFFGTYGNVTEVKGVSKPGESRVDVRVFVGPVGTSEAGREKCFRTCFLLGLLGT